MKYLKRFNESHTDDIIENVKDILLPINDMGYDISVNHYIINGDTNQLIIRVVTYVDKPLLITDEVKEEFIRMKDYLHSEGYDSIKAKFYLENRSQDEKDIDDFINIHTREVPPSHISYVKEPIVNLLFTAKKKLLKRFNESKQLDQSVIDECKDILLELEDKGIKTNIHSYINDQQYNRIINLKNNWIQFYFSRKEEFDYSDIEDVVERLKSYLSEYNLHIKWQNQAERGENKPTIKTTRVVNPMNFQTEGVRTQCELYFTSN